jgi:hypothetical protein
VSAGGLLHWAHIPLGGALRPGIPDAWLHCHFVGVGVQQIHESPAGPLGSKAPTCGGTIPVAALQRALALASVALDLEQVERQTSCGPT